MNFKTLSIVIIGILIFSVGISGCTDPNIGNGSNEPDYTNVYEADFTTVEYTSDIDSDNAQLTAETINGFIVQHKADEIAFQQSAVKAYVHQDEETTIIKIKTGFSNTDEITSTGEQLQNDLLDAFKDTYGDKTKLTLINISGEEFKTIE